MKLSAKLSKTQTIAGLLLGGSVIAFLALNDTPNKPQIPDRIVARDDGRVFVTVVLTKTDSSSMDRATYRLASTVWNTSKNYPASSTMDLLVDRSGEGLVDKYGKPAPDTLSMGTISYIQLSGHLARSRNSAGVH